jgi:small conductance mechanosensitive channel
MVNCDNSQKKQHIQINADRLISRDFLYWYDFLPALSMNVDEIYDKLITWLLDNGPKVLFGIFVFILGQWVIRLCRKWLHNRLHRREIDSSLRPFFHSLVVTGLQVLLLLTVMQIVGIQMTLFAAAIASLGVAAGLALSGTLQNFTGGILILILKPFKVGDLIIAQAQEGTVSQILIFHTIVTTADKKTVIIPNSKLSNEVIVNLSRQGYRRLDVELKFSYAFDIDSMKQHILQKLKDNEEVKDTPPAEVNVSLVEPDGYKLMASVWVGPENYNEMKLRVNQIMLDALKQGGVKLPGMA